MKEYHFRERQQSISLWKSRGLELFKPHVKLWLAICQVWTLGQGTTYVSISLLICQMGILILT